jgi:hypothetical protein
MAKGQRITRSVGFAIIRLDKYFTVDEVMFAEKGDLLLLGARTLEGLRLIVDSRKKSWWQQAQFLLLDKSLFTLPCAAVQNLHLVD